MASFSTSSIHKSFKYDVFLSFRGEDTRKNFVDHLYVALERKGIVTYKDDKRIEQGKRIDDSLMKAIEDSKLFIIVFSKEYASSSWCLDELIKIMECQEKNEHIAYPVFYDVEPTEVRNLSGNVQKAFAKHEKEEAKAKKWRQALKEAADLAGWELKRTADGHEAKFIDIIVESVSLKLCSVISNIDENLVGMDLRMSDMESSLNIGGEDFRFIGIKGIGGGGKTTLARAIYHTISSHFEGTSFVDNVREVSKTAPGLKVMQRQVLSDVSKIQHSTPSSVQEGKSKLKRMFCMLKVLVVLDDVDHIDQLEALAGEAKWYKEGSKVIITTRDDQVLMARHQVNLIHDVNLLSDDEATWLFCRYAFQREIPIQGYEELSRQVMHYAAGLPLTIKVLGSFLCSKNDLEWKDALERLKTIPLKETMGKLELSYIGLEDDYKEVFLNIACFLKRWDKNDATRLLESWGFHAPNGLKVLEQKSLINIYRIYDDEYIGMHDHIEEMGRNIIRRDHPEEPSKHSRLWIPEEIEHVLANDLGTEATRFIITRMGDFISPQIFMKGLGNMTKLRALHISSTSQDDFLDSEWEFDEAKQYFPNALRYLNWEYYPFKSLPTTFGANNLVSLEMLHSNIEQLWEGAESKVLYNLRFLDLSSSKLKKLDLGLTPNLKTLNLKECENLVELDSPLKCLVLRFLNLSYSKLRKLDLRWTLSLEKLTLLHCDELVQLHLPVVCLELKSLSLNPSKLKTLDLGFSSKIERLTLSECHDLVELFMPINRSLKLTHLNLNSSKLRTLDLRLTPNLEELHLKGCVDLSQLDMPFNGLKKLTNLVLGGLKLSTLDLWLAPNLKKLDVEKCDELVELRIPAGLTCLKLYDSKLKTLDLSLTSELEMLILHNCHDIEKIDMPVDGFPKLKCLTLIGLKVSILDLRLTPNLEDLHLGECDDVVELHMPIGCPELTYIIVRHSKLKNLNLEQSSKLETVTLDCHDLLELLLPVNGCVNLTDLELTGSKLRTLDLSLIPNLKKLCLDDCNELLKLQMPIESPKLTYLKLNNLKLKSLKLGISPNLYELMIEACHDFVALHMPVACPNLRSLQLRDLKLTTIDLKLTPNVQTLELIECHDLVKVETPFGCLKELVGLDLSGCSMFNSFVINESQESILVYASSLGVSPLNSDHCLPKFWFSGAFDEQPSLSIGNIEKLISLGLDHSTDINSYLERICGLRYLRELTLGGSIPDLPGDLDQLESLETLSLLSTEITHLPDSICSLKHLNSLKLHSCLFLEKLPKDLGQLQCLEELELVSTRIRLLPESFCTLKHLKSLTIDSCFHLEKLPNIALGQLECLEKLQLISIHVRHLPESFCCLKNLKSLTLDTCEFLENLPNNLGQLESLERLTLRSLNITHIPDSICSLKHLRSLKINYCKHLVKLPEELGRLECLRTLCLVSTYIKDVPDSICKLKHLKSLKVELCLFLENLPRDLGQLECLENLHLLSTPIKCLPVSICELKSLKALRLEFCLLLKELPADLGELECLEWLFLSSAYIKHLPDSICNLKHLKCLQVHHCQFLEKLPANLDGMESLKLIELKGCSSLKDISDGICNLKFLKGLRLPLCFRIEKLPEELGHLESLEELDVEDTQIVHLPQSLSLLKGLRIYGSVSVLQAFSFATGIKISIENRTCCDI